MKNRMKNKLYLVKAQDEEQRTSYLVEAENILEAKDVFLEKLGWNRLDSLRHLGEILPEEAYEEYSQLPVLRKEIISVPFLQWIKERGAK